MDKRKVQQSKRKLNTGRWTQEEHLKFMQAIMLHGNDWKKVQQAVGTRAGSQVRSHAQKFFIKLKKVQQMKKKGVNDINASNINTYQDQGIQDEGSENMCSHLLKGEFSNITPPSGLEQILKGQTKQGSQINIHNVKRQLSSKIQEIQQQQKGEKKQDKQQNEFSKAQKTGCDVIQKSKSIPFRNLNNLLTVYESTQKNEQKKDKAITQNQSFLIALMQKVYQYRKKYKNLILNTDQFNNLIDYGKSEIEKHYDGCRKRSFELPQGVEGSEEDLNQRKKLITESHSAKMKEQQKASFRQKMKASKNEESDKFQIK